MHAGRSVVTVLTFGSWLLAPTAARADAVGYAAVRNLRVESGTLVAEHHHDWSRATEPARFKMISTTKDPFTAENTYAYLRVSDKATGRELFKKPVSALTLLWISPDSRYVVGLSNVKLWNPYQIVVFDRAGRRVFERGINHASWPGVQESVTNAVRWYKEPTPAIRLEETKGEATLTIEDQSGTPREFRFPASK
jgi:hypothetical protein